MSFSQRQIWYLQRLNPSSSAYNIPFAVHVTGALSVPALARAFTRLAASAEVLRTTYGLVGGEPRQIIRTEAVLELEPEACESWTDEEIEDEIAREARRPFDLRTELPMRVRVLRRSPERWVVLWSLHHVAVDHLAVLRLGEALSITYEEEVAGGRSAGDPLKSDLQYADYAVWQSRELADGGELEDRLAFWRRSLEGAPRVLALPEDRPRSAEKVLDGRELAVRLDPSLRTPVLDAARRAGVSPFVLLLSAFKVAIGGYVGRDDVITGVPFANRPRLELEDVVGLFMNLLPIRVAWTADTTVADLLKRTRGAIAEGQRYQDTPFEKIVEGLGVRPDPATNPLVQTWFTFQEPPLQLRLPGLSTRTTHPHNAGAKLDLSLWLWDSGEAIEGSIEFASEVFLQSTVERFIDVFEHVVRQMVEAPDTTLAELDIVPPSQSSVIKQWQGEERPLRFETLVEGLLDSFGRHRDRSAVRDATRRWSYGELRERAEAVAASLRGAGVGPGDRVGVCLGRSADLSSSLVGVLLSGAAYVPLDPRFPEDRLRFILEDAGCSRVIVDESTSALVEGIGGEGVVIDPSIGESGGTSISEAGDQTTSSVEISGDDPAYLIYTSGSTGRPKGVVVPHRAVVNLLDSMASFPGCTSEDVLAAVTTLSFDISVLELFLPLWVGAECAIVEESALRNGRRLVEELVRVEATILQATPAMWRLLVQAYAELPGLRALCGGEALPADLANTLPDRVGTLFNMYGPTETTVWSTCGVVDGEDAVTIGRPIANTRVMIADDHGRPVPLGAAGEIWVGGTGVTVGYRNRDDLTETQFVCRDGYRWYRTGDLGRWLEDGRLRHLGRLDRQLKVRGFRIEPGEVEAAIDDMDDVAACVVTSINLGPGDDRLAVYIVPSEGMAPPTPTEVRRAARTHLPDYMVPNLVVAIEEIPTLPNGKVDVEGLPRPSIGRTDPTEDVDLRPGLEADIGHIWREMLKVEAVGAGDSFFDLGGHSLLAMQVVAAMQERLNVRIDPRSLYFKSLRQIAETATP